MLKYSNISFIESTPRDCQARPTHCVLAQHKSHMMKLHQHNDSLKPFRAQIVWKRLQFLKQVTAHIATKIFKTLKHCQKVILIKFHENIIIH
jgi:hypothetical protein